MRPWAAPMEHEFMEHEDNLNDLNIAGHEEVDGSGSSSEDDGDPT